MGRAIRAAVVAVIGAIAFITPTPANACSCAMPTDMATWISESPAVMVGTLLAVERGSDPFGQAVFRFQVEQWVKGDLGDQIDVHSVVGDGGNCGLFDNVGERVGLRLYLEDGHLTSNSCLMADPELLLGAQVDVHTAPPLTPDDGVEVLAGAGAIGSTNLARVMFLAITGAALTGAVVVYWRRDRQVKPPSAF
jgi:hypothetical protein